MLDSFPEWRGLLLLPMLLLLFLQNRIDLFRLESGRAFSVMRRYRFHFKPKINRQHRVCTPQKNAA